MVSIIETKIKIELDPIRRFVPRLPINAPYAMHVSQGGEGGVGLSKETSDNSGVNVGKVISIQMPQLFQ